MFFGPRLEEHAPLLLLLLRVIGSVDYLKVLVLLELNMEEESAKVQWRIRGMQRGETKAKEPNLWRSETGLIRWIWGARPAEHSLECRLGFNQWIFMLTDQLHWSALNLSIVSPLRMSRSTLGFLPRSMQSIFIETLCLRQSQSRWLGTARTAEATAAAADGMEQGVCFKVIIYLH